ncbi:MAG: MogA/MoaB family molybdenum cofactor biosynthesis protein [Hungatella sp.]
MYKVGIITLSDQGAAGQRQDRSGPMIQSILPKDTYEIVSYRMLSDDFDGIGQELMRLSDVESCHLILTTGGTGCSPRDNTPEATLAVATREVPGIAEALRTYSMTITKRAMLSRGVSVIRNQTLIINLPGSPKAVAENLEYLLDTLPHALAILTGRESECAGS